MEDVPLPKKVAVDTHLPTGIKLYGYTADQMLAYGDKRVAAERERIDEALRRVLREERTADAVFSKCRQCWTPGQCAGDRRCQRQALTKQAQFD
jgi:hypothetical protein